MKKNIPLLLFCLFMGLFSKVLLAQESPLDSLLIRLKSVKNLSPDARMQLYGELSDEYIKTSLPSALSYAFEQHRLALQTRNESFQKKASASIGTIYFQQGKNDSARWFFEEARKLGIKTQDEKEIHTQECNLANVFKTINQYDTAMVLYQRALSWYEYQGMKKETSQTLANIGTVFYIAGNQEKATDYTKQALEIQRAIKDEAGMGISLVNLLVFALNSGNYTEGIRYGEEAVRILEKINRRNYASALLRLGYCYYITGQTQKALQDTRKSIEIFKENNSLIGQMEGYRTLGDYYMEQKQYRLAKETGLKALAIADTTNRLDLRLLYDLLKRACIYLNQPDEAVHYSDLQIKMKEAAINDQWASRIAEMDTKYQTAKKEQEIAGLEAARVRQTEVLRMLVLLLVLFISAAIFLFLYMKQRRKMAEQRVLQLEQERQLVASNALLQGEETERSRLARDLHDGLGGLLTGIKMKLMNIKGNAVISGEGREQFDRALELLDTSLKELRSVAHNLMPETLIRFGLREAIDEYCAATTDTGLQLTFSFYGTARRLDSKTEVGIFRIVQELVNNIMKHSGAREAMVQLVMEEQRISLTVQDNGKGFDLEQLERSTGKGLPGIRGRVNAMHGNMDVSSVPEKGTEITIEIPFPSV